MEIKKTRNFLLTTMVLLGFGILGLATSNMEASAEESNTEIMETVEDVEKVPFYLLSKEEQQSFLEAGFNDTDEFVKYPSLTTDTDQKERLSNVVTVVGSTKRLSFTTARSTATVRSSSYIIMSGNLQITGTGGNKTISSSGKIPTGKLVSNVTLDTTYNGPWNYFTLRAAAQVTNIKGSVTAYGGIGGMNLGY